MICPSYLAPGGRIDERDGPFRPFFLSTGGPLIHGSVMKLSVSLSLSLSLSLARDRTNDSERKTRRRRNLSSFVLFYARIFRWPLLRPPPRRRTPTTVCPGEPAQIGPNGRYEGSDGRRGRGGGGRLPHCPFLPSSLSLSLSSGLRRTSSVKVECAALLDSVSFLPFLSYGRPT